MIEPVPGEKRLESGRALTASAAIRDSRRRVALEMLFSPVVSKLSEEKRKLESWNIGALLRTLFVQEKWIATRLNEIQTSLAEIVSIIQIAGGITPEEKMAVPQGTLLDQLSISERGLLAYLMGPMNQDTRIIEITHPESRHEGRVTIVSRFPGNANMMIPVIEELMKGRRRVHITAITDGKAKVSLEDKYKERLVDKTPKDEFYAANHTEAVGGADVVFLDAASGDALSVFMATVFAQRKGKKQPKIVIVHDAHTSTFRIYEELVKWKIPLLKVISKICVMDEWSKKKLIERYPFLTTLLVVTGQPLFDEMDDAEVKRRKEETRAALGIKKNEILLSVMLNNDPRKGETEAMGSALGKIQQGSKERLVVTIRRHPRLEENRYDAFVLLFKSFGLRVVDSMHIETKYVRVASDIVLNTISTEGTAAVAYGIPAIHVVDPAFGAFSGNPVLDTPPAEDGAALRLEDTNDLTETVEELMNPRSETSVNLQRGIKRHPLRKNRGKSAKNVANIARGLLPESLGM